MILRMDNYTNEEGMLLVERVLVDPTNQIPYDHFTGTAMIGVKDPQSGQVHGQQIDFPVTGNTVQEAFRNFKSSAEAFIERKKQEANRRIVTADSMPQSPPHDIVKKLLGKKK
jgi:predicted RNA-binding protein with PIN domain